MSLVSNRRTSTPIILLLFVFSNLVSQSAMDFFATLLILQVLITIYKNGFKYEIFPRMGFDFFWIAWFLVIASSFIFSPLQNTSWRAYLLEFRWIIQLYFVWWALRQISWTEKQIKSWVLFLTFCSSYAIVVWFLGFDPINKDYDLAPWVGGHRTGGFLSNAMTFAHVYSIHFCMIAGYAIILFFNSVKNAFRVQKCIVSTALLITGIAILLSFTRGAWIAMAMGLLVMLIVYNYRLALKISAMIVTLILIMMSLWPTFAQRMTMATSSGDERQWVWAGHWHIFKGHPWLGVGYGENAKIIRQAYDAIGAPNGVIESHAHNQYLHFLAGTGVIGLIFYLIFLFGGLTLAIKTYQKIRTAAANTIDSVEVQKLTMLQGLALGVVGAQTAFIFAGLTEANFEHSKIKYTMMIAWAFLLWIREYHFDLNLQKLRNKNDKA